MNQVDRLAVNVIDVIKGSDLKEADGRRRDSEIQSTVCSTETYRSRQHQTEQCGLQCVVKSRNSTSCGSNDSERWTNVQQLDISGCSCVFLHDACCLNTRAACPVTLELAPKLLPWFVQTNVNQEQVQQ
eukprot:m.42342 g.42342  ORF g.42342 m.42342 type:complete len:129 (+) comp10673_c0_seq2:1135-1521(+)